MIPTILHKTTLKRYKFDSLEAKGWLKTCTTLYVRLKNKKRSVTVCYSLCSNQFVVNCF